MPLKFMAWLLNKHESRLSYCDPYTSVYGLVDQWRYLSTAINLLIQIKNKLNINTINTTQDLWDKKWYKKV